MNVNAAAPTCPLPVPLSVPLSVPAPAPSPKSLRATGTDPHSHPGNAAPPTPATTIAALVRRGNQRASRSGVTTTAMSPLITTPSARNGRAWTNTPQNTVAAVATSGVSATNARSVVPASARPTMPNTSTCMEFGRQRATARFMATAP